MKKIAKILGVAATVGAVAAGGIAIYNKFFFSGEDDDELDDAFDDEFDDEFGDDLEFIPDGSKERSYVSLTPSEASEEEKSADTPAAAIPIV